MVVLQGVGQCDDLSLGVGAVLLRAKLRSDRLYVIRGFLVCVASCAKQAQKKAECNDPTKHLLLIFFLKQVSVCFCFVLLSKFFGKSNNNIGNDKSKIVKTGLAGGGSPTYVAGFVESGVAGLCLGLQRRSVSMDPVVALRRRGVAGADCE